MGPERTHRQTAQNPRHKLDRDENLADFGFDSISLAQFAAMLTNHYGIDITPALFFGYSALEKLTQYFLTGHQAAIQEFYREDAIEETNSPVVPTAVAKPKRQWPGRSRFAASGAAQGNPEPIAIIGMSGRFPGARNIDEMWAILAEGRDTVQEIPAERFDWRQYYGDPIKDPGKTNCKWCGCVPGVSEFDPLFFEISPREAETMDPRQRLLLQESWKALEDAGYGTRQIRTSKIGMFVGVEQGDYQLLVRDKGSVTSNHNAILAARLAYFLNLNGPVMALDTACSSGLVAAHQACLSLRNRECDTAIAAGVNLLLTQEAYIAMGQAGMLSEDGKCFAFDKRANGMVPGEAVAVVVLKRLSRAEADKDSIYAVIQGSAVNYDGKTNGITAPSGVAQTSLLKTVYEQCKVNPEEIEYIVTHGTGTKLGDPVEINALYEVFKDYTQKQNYCALTSTKTNFGHTFAASGLVSLISLVQALRHQIIPTSLHCEQENDYINWQGSPFYVNKTSKPWPKNNGKSRTGAVSAFGMSGTNVHMVLQSYDREETVVPLERPPYYLLALSARTQDALQDKIQDMISVLQDKDWSGQDLLRISYTLMDGRQHFNHRCAIVVQDREDAIYVWKQTGSSERLPNLFRGKVPRDFTGQRAIRDYAQGLLKQSRSSWDHKKKNQEILYALADLYCQGYELDWNQLYGDSKPRRISLPTYPFARERYWVPETTTAIARTATIHPLLHRNTSDFSEQRFTSTFTGKEFFLADHIINGQRLLPGVAYLEMARAAVEQATGTLQEEKTVIRLKNIVWARSIAVGDQPVQVHIGLFPEESGQIAYEIYVDETDQPVVHSQGSAWLISAQAAPTLNLSAIQAECSQLLDSSQVYEAFKATGIDYGLAHRGIEQLYLGENQVLARLTLPPSVLATRDQFILHPSIMDAALQASIGLKIGSSDTTPFSNMSLLKPSLPFALEEIDILGACAPAMWAFVRPSESGAVGDRVAKLDIDLCDEAGNICVHMKGLARQENFQAATPLNSLTPGTAAKHDFTTMSDESRKPNSIYLRSLSGENILTDKTADQPYRSIALSFASPSTSQPIISVQTKPAPYVQAAIPVETLQDELTTSLAEALYMKRSDVDIDKKFIDMGMDSIIGVEWIKAINKRYGISVPSTKVYDYPTISEFSEYLAKELRSTPSPSRALQAQEASMTEPEPEASMPHPSGLYPSNSQHFSIRSSRRFWHKKNQEQLYLKDESAITPAESGTKPLPINEPRDSSAHNIGENEIITNPTPHARETRATDIKYHPKTPGYREAIAIVGISGRYPGASNMTQYWDNLSKARNSIQEIPISRWDVNQYYDQSLSQKGKVYCKWIGALEDIESFDPLFFNISPAEAEGMDPQQRLFLQEGYKAFEDAGYNSQLLSNKNCGVYLGIMGNEYGLILHQNQAGAANTTGNSFAIAAARISYFLNLKGPAIPIDTACSSSLVATHLACQALANHEIDMALVGGVSLYLTPESYIGMCAAGMLSPDGQCKTFDNSANGFVPGEGSGALVLKRLQDAEFDHDQIYGVIIGSGINQDGKTNGITAPSVNSQIELERKVYDKHNICPESISYVEMHGTGTKLGDPIELEALSTVYKERTDQKNYCTIGSVKSNVGHTSAAAGVASVHKVLLCLKYKKLVPTLNFKEHNEHFNFKDSPFYVNTELKTWETAPGVPRRAAVSSFGFSGTNAHVVIEEYIPKERAPIAVTQEHPAIIVLSAKNEDRLKEQSQQLLAAIQEQQFSDTDLADIAYTLQVGREAMEERLAVLAVSIKELEDKLKGFVDGRDGIEDLYKGQVKRNRETLAVFAADEELQEAIGKWLQRGKYAKLLDLWARACPSTGTSSTATPNPGASPCPPIPSPESATGCPWTRINQPATA